VTGRFAGANKVTQAKAAATSVRDAVLLQGDQMVLRPGALEDRPPNCLRG
jgi:hypothetical protein